jgi:DNA (cytosine-5)-methyltransferase 1
METHAANLPGLSWAGDLTDPAEFLQTLEVWGIDSVDLVAGGVPCQPFSRAGRSRIRDMVERGERGAYDDRADLWESFIAVVEHLRPSAVLVENVPDLPRWGDGEVLMGYYESLQRLGYEVEARVLDGFRYGVPQHRQRLILIGVSGGRRPVWPSPTDEMVTLEDAICDLPPIPRAQRAEELPYDARRTCGEFQHEMREGLSGDAEGLVWEHICRDVRPDDLEAFSLLAEGQTYIDLPERLRRYRSDVFTDKYKRLAWGELCRSITAHIAKDGYWYIHPDQHRTLSIREAARVQTFPDRFRFAGTQTHRYRQIGNAVPVRLARAVGEAVRLTLNGSVEGTRATSGFREALTEWEAARPEQLPWRHGADPWRVLIAELHLRRMPVGAISGAYERLLAAAKTPRRVAADPEAAADRLIAAGLRSAAVLIPELAEALVDRFDGRVPEDEMSLRELPGVGDSICQAVRCFGFGRRAVLVDRASARVSSRVVGREEARRFQLRLDLYKLAGRRGPDADFNRAVIDLGDTVCRPARPLCGECPVRDHCVTGALAGSGDQLPLVVAAEGSL